MNKIKINCLCGKEYNENTFKVHYKTCKDFINTFKDLDSNISKYLKNYEPLLIRFLLKRYIKIIESKLNIKVQNNEKDISSPKKYENIFSNKSNKLSLSLGGNIVKNQNDYIRNIEKSFNNNKESNDIFKKVISNNIIFNNNRKPKNDIYKKLNYIIFDSIENNLKINEKNINDFFSYGSKLQRKEYENFVLSEVEASYLDYKEYFVGSSLIDKKEYEDILKISREVFRKAVDQPNSKISKNLIEKLNNNKSYNWLVFIIDNKTNSNSIENYFALNFIVNKTEKTIIFSFKNKMFFILYW